MITDLKINEEQRKKYYEKGYWTEDTIRDVWDRQAAAHRDDEYVADDQGARYTYGEIDDAASRLAAWLVDQGIESGDVVTLQFPNWAEFCIAYVACFKAGAVIQSLARNFNGADLTYAMNLVGSKAYIGPTYFHGVNYEEQILSIADDIPTLKAIALVDKKAPKAEGSTLPTVSEIVVSTDPLTSYPPVKSDEVACLLSTSGTTGKPKEVMLTHNNILFSEGVFVKGLERTEDDVMWMPAPLNHAVGFFHGLLSPMLLGGRSVLMQDFDVESAIKLINAENATWSMCSTPFIYDILKYLDAHPDESIPTYGLHSCGGAPVPGALIDRAHRHNILLCEIFGSTESCPHIYVPPSKCVEWNGDWSGVPFEGIEVRYVDEQGNDVAPGVQGEHISR
ncbi:MAG: AMP-binding protein, partial [Adlercreutzia sp.]|nr:AMP-binding protein [Adlercreutzia sp.]